MQVSYRSTVRACYVGNFVQAAVINVTPVLFIPLRTLYNLTYEQLGMLVMINFITQVTVDLICARFVDQYGFRRFAVAGHITAALGLVLFAALPWLMGGSYVSFVLPTIVFSVGGGLLELLLSPIVNAVPTDEKATAMSLLHSFYAWGQVCVVLVTSALLYLLKTERWALIPLFWAALPALNAVAFSRVPLGSPVPEGGARMPLRRLFRQPYFVAALATIAFGAMAEVSMSQWSSAFMEKALGLPKFLGDSAGMCMFAVMLGLGRAIYGAKGSRIRLLHVMTLGAAGAALCYVAVGVSSMAALSLAACALTGLCTSLLWPGTLVLAAQRFPFAGASMFAILAAAGDMGASVGPWLVGVITENAPRWPMLSALAARMSSESLGLHTGLLFAAVFPLVTLGSLAYLHAKRHEAPVRE